MPAAKETGRGAERVTVEESALDLVDEAIREGHGWHLAEVMRWVGSQREGAQRDMARGAARRAMISDLIERHLSPQARNPVRVPFDPPTGTDGLAAMVSPPTPEELAEIERWRTDVAAYAERNAPQRVLDILTENRVRAAKAGDPARFRELLGAMQARLDDE